jgi:hypothetical protein
VEAFEHVVKAFLELNNFIVTTNVKFPVARQTRKTSHVEIQTHGYEMDIVAARADKLMLGSVKSFFGSRGVGIGGFEALSPSTTKQHGGYKIFNDSELRREIFAKAAGMYGYGIDQIELRLFVGKFARRDEDRVRAYLSTMKVEVVAVPEIARGLVASLTSKTYIDDPVIMTLRVLEAAKLLRSGPDEL